MSDQRRNDRHVDLARRGGRARLRRGRQLALAGLLATLGSWAVSPGPAGAAVADDHGRFQCLGGQQLGVGAPMGVYATQANYHTSELVEWRVDLYRFDGTSWVLFDGSKPWYRALAGPYGVQRHDGYHSWWDATTGAPLYRVTYNGLPAGDYAAVGTLAGVGSFWLPVVAGGSGAVCSVVK